MGQNRIQNLPLGTSDFSALRQFDEIYVDKTEFIYGLASQKGKYLFVRPRRFGKSLLISTFESLFRHGLRDFKELAIERLWAEEPGYLVVRLDFSEIKIFPLLKSLQNHLSISNFFFLFRATNKLLRFL